ncbi:hypothetical protein RBH26_14570 [Natronolimnohabitans sp. A-GB9]|uniref:hypothetical protein n=1 Tax=Natronolimnohabitans sp. A-GB9 TaxID=3069757 RepID=UPI0027B13C71|nr:hypothetical protein [Natronolimnohabitans sp. A-GB9]MDQ2051700.1 hypothetical protein [Natronolimnohabitans sp. A-GB9]
MTTKTVRLMVALAVVVALVGAIGLVSADATPVGEDAEHAGAHHDYMDDHEHGEHMGEHVDAHHDHEHGEHMGDHHEHAGSGDGHC